MDKKAKRLSSCVPQPLGKVTGYIQFDMYLPALGHCTLISDVSFVPVLSIPVQFKVHTEYIS